MVGVVVTLIMCVIIYSQVSTTLTTGQWNTNYSANTANDRGALESTNNVTKNAYDAFNLTSIAPTIMGAVLVLGIVGLLLARR